MIKWLIIPISALIWSCDTSGVQDASLDFDAGKWAEKIGYEYPFRDAMLEDLMRSDTIRTLKRDQLLAILGYPDRENENHLYYIIKKENIGVWTLHQKTLVVKLQPDGYIDWMKIHE